MILKDFFQKNSTQEKYIFFINSFSKYIQNAI